MPCPAYPHCPRPECQPVTKAVPLDANEWYAVIVISLTVLGCGVLAAI